MPETKTILLTGNEAIALGALKAGLKFYAAYPMTPATSILHFLAGHEHQYKIIVKQTEDELAAMNMVIGASVAGARAMCATSGGGFALMTEALGFAGMIETPLVCAVISRPGPATGLPTWSAQGDLQFILHAAPDEFPRIVLAPGDALEAFYLTFYAFNLADKYQMPVLILSDKLLGESYFTVEKRELFKGNFIVDRGKIVKLLNCSIADEKKKQQFNNRTIEQYKRYDSKVEDGVSLRALPGTPGHLFLANSDEHDEFGYSEEDSQNRVSQMSKRMRKLKTIVKDKALALPKWYGPRNASCTLICWGSAKGVSVEIARIIKSKIKNQKSKCKNLNVLHFNQLYPLDVKRVKKELLKIKKSICVESNYSGQFADYLFEKTGYKVDQRLLKYDGRPLFVEELIKEFVDLNF